MDDSTVPEVQAQGEGESSGRKSSRSPRRSSPLAFAGDVETVNAKPAGKNEWWSDKETWEAANYECAGKSEWWSSRETAEMESIESAGKDSWWSQRESGDELADPWYIDEHELVLQPSGSAANHRFTLFLLHSCSGGPDDWLPFFHRLNLPFRNSIRVVLPCAPIRSEEHGGWRGEMNSWFEYEGNGLKNRLQLLEQRKRLLALLERERQLLPESNGRRLVLGGLSQGVALAIDVALHAPFAVGGVLALRGSALLESLSGLPERSPGNTEPSWFEVMAFHGEHDRQCTPDEARESYWALRPHGVEVSFEVEPSLGHACARGRQKLCAREISCINAFLARVWAGF